MPLRYIHELIRIIEDDDFAWPRSLASSEYFMRHDSAASEHLRKIETEISGIEDRAVPDELLLLGYVYSRRDTVLEEVDTVAYNLHACFALVQRARVLSGLQIATG